MKREGPEDDLPRLPPAQPPPKPARDPDQEPVFAQPRLRPATRPDFELPSAPDARLRGMHWTEYTEPQLSNHTPARQAVQAALVLVLVWSTAVVVVAAAFRSGRLGDVAVLDLMAWVGVGCAALVSVAGWWWSDLLTRNIHRLGGRLPTRLRCLSAWTQPLLWLGLMAISMIRMDPTEPADVRPAIIVIVMSLAVWRPFQLVRRIQKSLIPVDIDDLAAVAYFLTFATFGIVLWRLWTFPADGGGGAGGVLFGLSAAALITSAGMVLAWVFVLRAIDRAVEHRSMAMRTRHVHKQLRLHGIDPMDRNVRLALLYLQREANQAIPTPLPGSTFADRASTPASTVTADRSADRPERPPLRIPDEPVAQSASVDDVSVADASSQSVDVAPTAASSGAAVDQAIVTDVPELVAETQVAPTAEGDTPVASDRLAEPGVEPEAERQVAPDAAQSGEVDAVELAPALGQLDRLASSVADELSDGADDRSLLERLVSSAAGELSDRSHDRDVLERLVDASEADASARDRHPLDRLADRYEPEDPLRSGTLLQRLEQMGITPAAFDAPPGANRTSVPPLMFDDDPTGDQAPDDRPLAVEQLYSLESARYLVIGVLAAAAAAWAWFVVRTIGSVEVEAGRLLEPGRARVDAARRLAVGASLAASSSLVLWAAAAASWASRVGIGGLRTRWAWLLAGVSVVAAGAGFVVVGKSELMTGASAAVCLACAWLTLPIGKATSSALQLATVGTRLVHLLVSFAVGTALLSGLGAEVSQTASVETLSFVGGLQTVTLAIAAITLVVSTSRLVEAVRVAPATLSHGRRPDRDATVAS